MNSRVQSLMSSIHTFTYSTTSHVCFLQRLAKNVLEMLQAIVSEDIAILRLLFLYIKLFAELCVGPAMPLVV